jgi:hypothetical protein
LLSCVSEGLAGGVAEDVAEPFEFPDCARAGDPHSNAIAKKIPTEAIDNFIPLGLYFLCVTKSVVLLSRLSLKPVKGSQTKTTSQ